MNGEGEGLRQELRRARILVGLLREANRLADESVPADQIPRRLLRVVLAGFGADRGAVLRIVLPGAAAEIRHAVGLPESSLSGLTVPASIGDFFIAGDGDSDQGELLCELVGRDRVLWARDPATGAALLLGADRSGDDEPLFDSRDRAVVEELLRLHVELVERRLQARMVHESEERYRSFVENMGDAAFRADLEGRVTFVNQKAAEVVGVSEEELVGTSFLDLFAEEDHQRVLAIHERIISGNGAQAEVRFINGIFAHVVAQPLRDRSGSVVGVFGTFRDVTDRHHAEQTLRNLVEHSLQGLFILQEETVVYANPVVAEMLGSDVQSLTGVGVEEMLRIVHPDDREMVWSRFRQRREGLDPPPRYELRLTSSTGDVITVEMYATRTVFEGRPAIQVALLDIGGRGDARAGCEDE